MPARPDRSPLPGAAPRRGRGGGRGGAHVARVAGPQAGVRVPRADGRALGRGARGAVGREMDLTNYVWTVPASRKPAVSLEGSRSAPTPRSVAPWVAGVVVGRRRQQAFVEQASERRLVQTFVERGPNTGRASMTTTRPRREVNACPAPEVRAAGVSSRQGASASSTRYSTSSLRTRRRIDFMPNNTFTSNSIRECASVHRSGRTHCRSNWPAA